MSKSLEERFLDSFKNGGNSEYLEILYEDYLENPNSLPSEWKKYFDSIQNGQIDVSHKSIEEQFKNKKFSTETKVEISENSKASDVQNLINAYRRRGHQVADIDPLGLRLKKEVPDLELGFHNLSENDLESSFSISNFQNAKELFLKDIISSLKQTYTSSLGYEFMHIMDSRIRRWFLDKIEGKPTPYSFNSDEQEHILKRLVDSEGLEKFLASKYPGAKRFGLEGGESLVPLLDTLIEDFGSRGVKELVLGMSHRGRLNVLINVMGKKPSELFTEFAEDFEEDDTKTGDVKYHLGFSSNILTSGGEVHLALGSNPSHLEIVNPVILGSVKARQDRRLDSSKDMVVPILMHGDASFSAQGVVMEILQLSQTRAYGVGGTVHIVVNNQIGFTTSLKEDARSTEYCTDVAKIIDAPIIHVNGDDPEASVMAAKLAVDFRDTFKRDIIVDFVCYRRRGHNETDEPFATQPMMYKEITSKNTVTELYLSDLLNSDSEINEKYEVFKSNYRKSMEKGEMVAESMASDPDHSLHFDWSQYIKPNLKKSYPTNVSLQHLKESMAPGFDFDEGTNVQKQVAKLYDDRKEMLEGKIPMNWGFAEMAAYATLLKENYPVRITGQDSRRGTFSHRHLVIKDQLTGVGHVPLAKLNNGNKKFEIYDSLLSEEAVLGFEYGYASTWPEGLVIWEAQFGDFVNVAQVVIDQFIVSAQTKWDRLSGLTMFLPHGYEGQGPEHSSCRLERFLQLCAHENIQVCVPTLPSQIFHLLRRQAIKPLRRPLVVLTPKSLLRNPMATSELSDLTNGTFKNIIIDQSKNAPRKIILCAGKIYFDLLKHKDDKKVKNVEIVRIEQLYPFPDSELISYTKNVKSKDFVWVQEEPENMGAWLMIRHRLEKVLNETKKGFKLSVIARDASASPAGGYQKYHIKRQKEIVAKALEL
ncbi:MAG: 2-oxoglutarate dehydrogenase E1 component [Gammaproteobacteria bacterium]